MADLKLNAAEWNSISLDQQNRIKQILLDCRLLTATDRIVADPSAPTLQQLSYTIPTSVCKAACVGIEALAIAACAMLPTPVEIAVCIAAARAAGEYCKNNCP